MAGSGPTRPWQGQAGALCRSVGSRSGRPAVPDSGPVLWLLQVHRAAARHPVLSASCRYDDDPGVARQSPGRWSVGVHGRQGLPAAARGPVDSGQGGLRSWPAIRAGSAGLARRAAERPVLTVAQVFELAESRLGRRPVGSITQAPGRWLSSPIRPRHWREADGARDLPDAGGRCPERLEKMVDEGRADCDYDRRFRAMVLLATFTAGLRWGEVTALRRCDVDLEAEPGARCVWHSPTGVHREARSPSLTR